MMVKSNYLRANVIGSNLMVFIKKFKKIILKKKKKKEEELNYIQQVFRNYSLWIKPNFIFGLKYEQIIFFI